MKIIADDKIPFLRGALEPYAEVQYYPGNVINHDIIKDADALIIRTRTKCTPELLQGTSVRFIGTATIGYDHIDVPYCDQNGIKWTNAPGCNSSSVQQYVASAMLSIAHSERFALKDKTLGIVGVGNVGTKVEKFARTIGMRVILNDPPRARYEGSGNFQDLGQLLEESDIITVHVPLNMSGIDRTFHLFNDDVLLKMKKKAWYINAARGEVNDTAALKKKVYSEDLGGIVIDVWENEPDIDRELLDIASFTTPHIAGYSTDGKANGTAMVVNDLKLFFNLPDTNWFPENIPVPESTSIPLNCAGKSSEDILREAVIRTYNIMEDDIRLRHAPEDFEKLRGNYPLRREFGTFTANLKNGTEEMAELLRLIGFNVKKD
jgi:erythronate-4-phosphate dehydrogenase